MYTKIICPVDFSETSINAVEFAAKVAQQFSIELFLLNVRPLLVSELIGGGADMLRETTVDAKRQLNSICLDTNKMLHISCESEVVVSPTRFEKILSRQSKESTIIVMGTNGVDDLYQYFFGTHTFNVIKKVRCPVVLIPDSASYFTISELVFVWAHEGKLKEGLEQAIGFAKLFNVSIHLLFINRKDTAVSKEFYRASLGEASTILDENNIKFDYEHVFSKELDEGINQVMIKKETSLLIIPIKERGVVESIFKKNSIKKISATTSFPIIFIHEEEMHN